MIRSQNKRRATRRGSIYVVTLSTGLIVAVLATTALTTVRVQRLQNAEVTDMQQTQIYAESALALAKYRMLTSSTFRSQLESNTWAADQSIADGNFNFTGSDPVDNILTNSIDDPVAIVATGKKGTSVYKLKGTLEYRRPGINCLGSGVHARDDLIVDNATLESFTAPCSSDDQVTISTNGKIYSNCETANNVNTSGGGQLFGSKSENRPAKQMPSGSNIFNSYLTNGTTIPIASLPSWDFNYLTNPGAEVDVANWTPNNCTVARNTTQFHSGVGSFYVSGRNIVPLTYPSYIYQNVASLLERGVDYYLESWVYIPDTTGADNFRIKLQVNASGGNVAYTTPWVSAPYATWTCVSGTGNITWSGTLVSAYWYVESQTYAYPYHVDDCVMKEANTRALHGALLTPAFNSVTGVTNSQGIYILDCQGQSVNIRDSRINGTLVLRDPGLNSRIERSVHLTPAVSLSTDLDTPNLLALVSEKKIKIALSAANLDEAVVNCNFNPAGSPYQGVTDADLSDVYPSRIEGIIYSLDDLMFGGTTTINGVVISDKKVEVRGNNPATTTLIVHHNELNL